MVTIETLFRDLGGPAEIGRIIGKPTEHARLMRRRGSVPVSYWPSLIAAAKQRGIDGITYETLVEAHTAKSEAA